MKKYSLSTKLTISFLIFLLLPVYITQIILFGMYKSSMDSLVNDYLQKSFNTTYESANNRFSDMANASTYFTLNSEFKNILSHSFNGIDRQFYEDIEQMDKFFDFAQSITKINKIYFTLLLNDGRVFGNWGTLPTGNDQMEIREWINSIIRSEDPMTWTNIDTSNLFEGSTAFGPPLVSLIREVGKREGFLIVTIEEAAITEFLGLNESSDNDLTTLICDNTGKVMYNYNNMLPDNIKEILPDIVKSTSSIASKLTDKGGFYIFSREMTTNNWTLLQIVNESFTYNRVLYMRNQFMIISLIFLVIFIGITYLISFGTTRSIKTLEAGMKKFGEGDFDVEVKANGSDEISELTMKFNKMVKQIQYLIGELKKNEREKTQIYYESLIAQINPHFLYNTLNSIKWTAALSNSSNVVDLLVSLGALLEASTSRKGDIVTLEEEVSYVKHYMNLQYSRYGEKIKIHFCIPAQAYKLLIPKFIIQPIVENSIIHAFDQHEIKGDIYIHAVLKETYLLLLIRDNGKGIDYEKTMEIISGKNEKPNSNKYMGIGISSVHKRIQILYGESYGLVFSTEIGIGTVFRLKLPIYKQDEAYDGENNV